MMLRLLSAEFLKIRKKLLWLLVALGPVGVVGLQAVNFGLRYDYLTKQYARDLWGGLITNVSLLALPAMFIGLAIVASMSAGIEHQTNAWKMTLALPISKRQAFGAKFLLNVLLLFVSCTLLVPFTLALGWALGFAAPIPAGELLRAAYYPFLACMPFVALQSWLSVTFANQALPLTVGIIGMIAAMFGSRFPDWMPWKWPLLVNAWHEPLYSVGLGLLLGAAVFLIGMLEFARKDVK
ncbi:ABC transporter permease [Cohnella nanjingensis]|uniref:ABC transporter permease n=1 Tax=Cohnella nanjingensis TaxID=1387779 RepID=A0A7X0VG71_9BACL|nr:ABC transporter permease [Cohnella nanjingensis]MBB6671349.1 ABC transporter permease [Cohnella nanjingensis]